MEDRKVGGLVPLEVVIDYLQLKGGQGPGCLFST